MENDSLLGRLSATAEKAMLVDSKVEKAVEELFWIAVTKSQDEDPYVGIDLVITWDFYSREGFDIHWAFYSREVFEKWEADGSDFNDYRELGSFLADGPFGVQVGELIKNLPAGFNWWGDLILYEDDSTELGDWFERCHVLFENKDALLESSVFIKGVLNQATSLQTDSPIHQWMLTFVLETFTTAE